MNTAWLSAPVGVAFTAVVWLVYPRLIQNDAFLDVKENREVRPRTRGWGGVGWCACVCLRTRARARGCVPTARVVRLPTWQCRSGSILFFIEHTSLSVLYG